MSDEYRYRVSMTCETHGGIHGYTYCPECTIAALRGEVEQWKCAAAEDRQFYREEREKRLQAEAALARYREAVEWALKEVLDPMMESTVMQGQDKAPWALFRNELRRRAGEG